jgi:hypothetical protein
MLENLTVSDVLAEARAPGRWAWVDWRHLGHPLYREDRVTLALGSRLPLGGLQCAVAPSLKRSAVRGFPAASFRSLSVCLGYARGGALELGVAGTPFNDEPGARREAVAAFSIHAAPFSISMERDIAGARQGDTKLCLLAELDGNAALVSSYRSRTDELLAGLIVRVRPILIGLSWSYNPALGKTISAGLGRWWSW